MEMGRTGYMREWDKKSRRASCIARSAKVVTVSVESCWMLQRNTRGPYVSHGQCRLH